MDSVSLLFVYNERVACVRVVSARVESLAGEINDAARTRGRQRVD